MARHWRHFGLAFLGLAFIIAGLALPSWQLSARDATQGGNSGKFVQYSGLYEVCTEGVLISGSDFVAGGAFTFPSDRACERVDEKCKASSTPGFPGSPEITILEGSDCDKYNASRSFFVIGLFFALIRTVVSLCSITGKKGKWCPIFTSMAAAASYVVAISIWFDLTLEDTQDGGSFYGVGFYLAAFGFLFHILIAVSDVLGLCCATSSGGNNDLEMY